MLPAQARSNRCSNDGRRLEWPSPYLSARTSATEDQDGNGYGCLWSIPSVMTEGAVRSNGCASGLVMFARGSWSGRDQLYQSRISEAPARHRQRGSGSMKASSTASMRFNMRRKEWMFCPYRTGAHVREAPIRMPARRRADTRRSSEGPISDCVPECDRHEPSRSARLREVALFRIGPVGYQFVAAARLAASCTLPITRSRLSFVVARALSARLPASSRRSSISS